MVDKYTLFKLINEVLKQEHAFYNLIKEQYPSENWQELTGAEQNMLLWFNDFEAKYNKYDFSDMLEQEAEKEKLN